ncbi:MAG: 3-methyl-2-oxobutanoate dehydrogenase subunit VorB [Planctomycetota bacterium]
MSDRTLMCGNEAIAEAAIRHGLDAYFGYPITPQNEIAAHMSRRMPEEGRVFLQSESELAAINMVFGAAATGDLAMTTSSSPGVSLMQEGLSYLAGADLPAVIVNVMRGGPGLGNIAPAQGDYFQAVRGGGHGDYRTPTLAPASVQEMADAVPIAFDIAWRYRTPVMIIADGILGQMMEPLVLPEMSGRRRERPLWALTGAEGRQRRIVRSLYLGDGELERVVRERFARYAEIERTEVRAETRGIPDAEVVCVAYGICARIVRAACARARTEGIRAGWIRPITLWPFPADAIRGASGKGRVFLAVEMSMGQMVDDVRLSLLGRAPVRLLGRPGGGIPTEDEVLREIRAASDAARAGKAGEP